MARFPRQSVVALLIVASLATGSSATMRAHQAPTSATDSVRVALSESGASADSGPGPVLSADAGIFDSLRIAGLVRRVWYGPVWNDVVVGRLVDSDTDVLILMVRLSESGRAGQRWRVLSQTPAVDSITVWRGSLVRVTLDSVSGRTMIGRIRGADSLALRLSAMAREAGPALATALDLQASDSLTRDSVARDSVVVCTEPVAVLGAARRRTRLVLIGGAVGLVAAIRGEEPPAACTHAGTDLGFSPHN